ALSSCSPGPAAIQTAYSRVVRPFAGPPHETLPPCLPVRHSLPQSCPRTIFGTKTTDRPGPARPAGQGRRLLAGLRSRLQAGAEVEPASDDLGPACSEVHGRGAKRSVSLPG